MEGDLEKSARDFQHSLGKVLEVFKGFFRWLKGYLEGALVSLEGFGAGCGVSRNSDKVPG